MTSRSGGTIASVERAFAVLQVVATAGRSLGVSELARRCGLPKTTVVRLVRTLEALEVLDRVSASGGYRLGAAVTRLASGDAAPGHVRELARPLMRALVDEVEEDVALAVADGARMLFVDQISCENAVQVPDWSGQRLPYHAAAAGYALLAGMDGAAVDELVGEGLEPWTEWTVTDEERVRRRIARARERGVAWVREEWARGVVGVAAPVRDADGRTVAAINVYGPMYRFPGSRSEEDIERRVVAAADAITRALTPGRAREGGGSTGRAPAAGERCPG